MSKSNDSSKLGRAPQVQELRDDELQEVSGRSNEVTSIVAPRDINSGHTVGLVAPLHSPL